jgi:iron complex outermembrane recepter protein
MSQKAGSFSNSNIAATPRKTHRSMLPTLTFPPLLLDPDIPNVPRLLLPTPYCMFFSHVYMFLYKAIRRARSKILDIGSDQVFRASQVNSTGAIIDSLKPSRVSLDSRRKRGLSGIYRTVCMRPRRIAAGALALALILSPEIARARDTQNSQNDVGSLKQLSLEQLGNVEVTTASKEPEEVWKTPAAIFVITQEDIRRSGATSIPEILRLAPGVEVARIDSDHWSVGIRGFGSQFSKAVLVLIDGRSVYTPLFAGVYWEIQDTLLEDIERIEVIRGPGGTIWGANAVNGIINIITKNAKDTHGALATAGGGNVDQAIGGARFGGSNGKGFNYRVYGKGFLRGPEFHPDNSNFDYWKTGQLGFRTDSILTDRDTLTVQGDLYKGLDGERVSVSSYTPPSVAVIDAPHEVSGGNILARWQRKFSENSDVQVQAYFDRTSRFSPQLDEVRNTFDVDLLYHMTLAGNQDFLWGAGARLSPDTITQKFPTLDFEPHQETDSIYSWFLQDQIPIVADRLWLTVGSKFENNNYSGFEIQPNVRLLWAPTDHQSVWAAVTRAVRTPSRLDQDLQLTDFLAATTFLRVVGSRNFNSEQLLSYEIGYRTLLAKKFYVDIATFYDDYNDLYGYGPGTAFLEPALVPGQPVPPGEHLVLQLPVANALAGNANGVEVAPDWKPVDWWELRGSYSYLHLTVHTKPGFTDPLHVVASDNGSSPEHQIQLQSLLNLPKKLELDLTFRYISALPAQTVEAYESGDIRFGWHPTENWELSVAGQNLLQPHHAEFGGDYNTIVGIDRSAYAKITWRK